MYRKITLIFGKHEEDKFRDTWVVSRSGFLTDEEVQKAIGEMEMDERRMMAETEEDDDGEGNYLIPGTVEEAFRMFLEENDYSWEHRLIDMDTGEILTKYEVEKVRGHNID